MGSMYSDDTQGYTFLFATIFYQNTGMSDGLLDVNFMYTKQVKKLQTEHLAMSARLAGWSERMITFESSN